MSDRLDETQFTHRVTKEGKLFIAWYGREVRSYKSVEAVRWIRELERAASPRDVQRVLARATGHFKRGNER